MAAGSRAARCSATGNTNPNANVGANITRKDSANCTVAITSGPSARKDLTASMSTTGNWPNKARVASDNAPTASWSAPRSAGRGAARRTTHEPHAAPAARPERNVASMAENAYTDDPSTRLSALDHTTSLASAAAPETANVARTRRSTARSTGARATVGVVGCAIARPFCRSISQAAAAATRFNPAAA